MNAWKSLCGALFAALLAGGALADEAMVTLFKGQGTLLAEQDRPGPIVPFMKLRRGDRLELAEGSRLRILYAANGRQETWTGKALIEVGGGESLARTASAPPEVKQLPAAALMRLAQAPAVLNDLRNRTGMVMVRSGGLLEKIREIEAVYEQMRRNAAPDDVTPELYLVSGLHDLQLYRDMEEILADIVSRQPDNAEARAIMENLRKALEPPAPQP